MPKYHKLQRATCLALFAIASIASYFKPHLVPIAALALVGVVAYDLVSYLKHRAEPKDFSADIARLEQSQQDLISKVSDIRNDASIGKLAETFRRK